MVRILVAEDSPTQAEQLRHILERHSYEVTVAANGAAALAKLAEFRPGVVISDIVMPELDGYELCRRIRADKNTSDLPVLLLTALTDTQDVLEGLSCGADSFITKPYDEEYLLVQVARMISERQRSESPGSTANVDIMWAGKKCTIVTDQIRTINLLISTYEAAVRRNTELSRTQKELRSLNDRLEDLVAERTAALSTENAVRRQAEAALRESEEKYRTLVDNAEETIAVAQDGWLKFVSSRATELTGYSERELTARPFFEFTHPDDRDMVMENSKKRLKGEPVPARYAFRIMTVEGVAKWVEMGATLIEWKGRPATLSFLTDITKRKRAEEQLTRLFQQQELILYSAAEGILGVDVQGNHIFVNPAAAGMLGYGAEELLGRPSHETWHHTKSDGSPYPREECQIYAAYRDGKVHRSSTEVFWRKDGMSFPVEYASTPIWEQGRPVGAVVTFAGIAERLRNAEEKAGLEAQLRQAQKIEAIGRLAGGVAHDFNNLTAIVLGYGEMLLDQLLLENPARKWAEQIVAAGRRSAALTRQLLAFSRKQTLQPAVLDLNSILHNLEEMLHRLIGEDIELVFRLAGGLGRVKADPGQLEQIVTNLVLNGRDAMPLGGRLTIETADVELDEMYAMAHESVVPGSYVMLALTDTGCGMDKATMARLFEPFFTTKPKGKGTGLGLATAYGIVKQSGGHIWAYSELDKGTTFRIYLPRTEDQPEAKAVEILGETPRGRGERIMLVEDEKLLRELCETVLARLGYQVSATGNGCEALALVQGQGFEPDLVLTDVIMPVMSGAELADQLRRARPELRVLYMSGYPEDIIAPHGVLDPGIAFIQKPFTERALAVKVRDVLGGKAASARPGMRVLMIDDDEQFRELMRYFCRKRGHHCVGVASSAAALEALVGQHFDVLLVDLHLPGTNGELVLWEIRAAGHTAPAIVLTGDVASADMDALHPLGAARALDKSVPAELLLKAIEEYGVPGDNRRCEGEDKRSVP